MARNRSSVHHHHQQQLQQQQICQTPRSPRQHHRSKRHLLPECSTNSRLDKNRVQITMMPHPGWLCQLRQANQWHLTYQQDRDRGIEPSSKVLVDVTVLGSVGPLRFVLDARATVNDVLKHALQQYNREGRIPSLGFDSARFLLYCFFDTSQALEPDMQIGSMGIRQFLASPKHKINHPVNDSETQQQRGCAGNAWKKWWADLVSSVSSHLLLSNDLKLPSSSKVTIS